MRTKPPCKSSGVDCPRRAVGCQSKCEEYQKWQQIHQQERAARWLYYASANDADAHTLQTIEINAKRANLKRQVGQR